jgi:hypothetical protein
MPVTRVALFQFLADQPNPRQVRQLAQLLKTSLGLGARSQKTDRNTGGCLHNAG